MGKRGVAVITESDSVGMNEWYCEWFGCPSCGDTSVTYDFKFCPGCGIKLKFEI